MSMPSDPTLYDGRLSDGRTAAAVAVEARLGEAGLEILPAGERRAALVWPYAELQSSVPLKPNAPDVLLSLKPNGSQTLFVANPAFSQGLLAQGERTVGGAPALAGPAAGHRDRCDRGRACRERCGSSSCIRPRPSPACCRSRRARRWGAASLPSSPAT